MLLVPRQLAPDLIALFYLADDLGPVCNLPYHSLSPCLWQQQKILLFLLAFLSILFLDHNTSHLHLRLLSRITSHLASPQRNSRSPTTTQSIYPTATMAPQTGSWSTAADIDLIMTIAGFANGKPKIAWDDIHQKMSALGHSFTKSAME